MISICKYVITRDRVSMDRVSMDRVSMDRGSMDRVSMDRVSMDMSGFLDTARLSILLLVRNLLRK